VEGGLSEDFSTISSKSDELSGWTASESFLSNSNSGGSGEAVDVS